MSKCSFCRNDNATNEHPYEGDFIFVMCDDCDARYKKNKQLGPKFLICKCDPKNPKELDLAMATTEILQNKKEYQQDKETDEYYIDKIKSRNLWQGSVPDSQIKKVDESTINKIIHETSGYIPKDENDNKFKARQEEYKNSRRRKKV